ncbi:stage VI sporulation protein F [Siminovitchia sediminis]|uniref:Stage VI sporulation protein F n=1 Tax=Siminovitchia sediminis TaxID=1274353 RepID=A0ABW4KCD2_9BACI
MDNQFFKNIESKTGVNMDEVLKLANSLQNANFKDEKTVRQIIRKVAKIANRPVSREMENKMVQTIIKDGSKLDMNTIAEMMNKKP